MTIPRKLPFVLAGMLLSICWLLSYKDIRMYVDKTELNQYVPESDMTSNTVHHTDRNITTESPTGQDESQGEYIEEYADNESVDNIQPHSNGSDFVWTPPTVPTEISHADQTDEELAKHIRDHWILPPATEPRKLKDPSRIHYSQRGQSEFVDHILVGKKDGFFIECGAANGEVLSNSLFFEKSRNWSGLLIEANPGYFGYMLKLNRHAYSINACLSPTRQPEVLEFTVAGVLGGLSDFLEEDSGKRASEFMENTGLTPKKIQCFPLLAILKAMNIKHVDYFSLDIEGPEMAILKNFPFDEIAVDVLSVEFLVQGDNEASLQKKNDILDLMINKYGYELSSYHNNEDMILIKGI